MHLPFACLRTYVQSAEAMQNYLVLKLQTPALFGPAAQPSLVFAVGGLFVPFSFAVRLDVINQLSARPPFQCRLDYHRNARQTCSRQIEISSKLSQI